MTTTATFELRQMELQDGQPAILIVVRNAVACRGLCPLLDHLGVLPTPDLANHRSALVTTPGALDAIREPLLPYLDRSAVVDGQAPFVRAVESHADVL